MYVMYRCTIQTSLDNQTVLVYCTALGACELEPAGGPDGDFEKSQKDVSPSSDI